MHLVEIMLRGYEGPILKVDLFSELCFFLPSVNQGLKTDISEKELHKAFDFLQKKESHTITLGNAESLRMVLPAGEDRYYLDYSLITDILDDMFIGIPLNKHNFRGEVLERAVKRGISYLPTTPCRSINKSQKQIDYSIRKGNLLIIAECKVVAMSKGFYNGDFRSYHYRNKAVIERGLNEVDDKAIWLRHNPVGTNYNLNGIAYILPVVISPFVEFIPSIERQYWISENCPRVVTIEEFNRLCDEEVEASQLFNIVRLAT
jgi:hypothetical protein